MTSLYSSSVLPSSSPSPFIIATKELHHFLAHSSCLESSLGGQDVIVADLGMSVFDLKNAIAQQHPQQPRHDSQRLIFGGRMLADEQVLRDLISPEQFDLAVPVRFHFVMRQPNPPFSPAPSMTSSHSSATQYFSPSTNLHQSHPSHLHAQQQFQTPPNFAASHPPRVNNYNSNLLMNQQQFHPEMNQQDFAQAQAHYPQPQFQPGVQQRAHHHPHIHFHAARVFHIDLGLIAKLILLVYILSRGGGEERLAILITAAIGYYIYQAGLMRHLALQAPPPRQQPQQQAQANRPANEEGNEGAGNVGNARNVERAELPFWARREGGLAGEVLAFVVPLVLSINPSWRLPEALTVPEAPVNQEAENDENAEGQRQRVNVEAEREVDDEPLRAEGAEAYPYPD